VFGQRRSRLLVPSSSQTWPFSFFANGGWAGAAHKLVSASGCRKGDAENDSRRDRLEILGPPYRLEEVLPNFIANARDTPGATGWSCQLNHACRTSVFSV